MRNNKIAVIYSQVDPLSTNDEEKLADKDTYDSAQLVYESLLRQGYEAELYGMEPNNIEVIKKIKADIFFNMCEWTGNKSEKSVRVVKILEQLNRNYTGGDLMSQIWGNDKVLMKKEMARIGLPIPRWTSDDKLQDAVFPSIVKTSKEHCSIGISAASIVKDGPSLVLQVAEMRKKFSQPLIIEEFLPGNEYQAFVIGTNKAPLVLPLYETVYKMNAFDDLVLMTFDDNWSDENVSNKVKRIGIANDGDLTNQIVNLARKAFVDLECVGYIRLDFRVKDGKPYVLEINVNPGLGWGEDEDVAVSARAANLSFDQLIKLIIDAPRHVTAKN